MSIYNFKDVISQLISFLDSQAIKYALVGGLAVSFRTIERATRDIDLAIAAKDDQEAEQIIYALKNLGFSPDVLINHKKHNRIATIRLLSQGRDGFYLDLLFASSGIEEEIIQLAGKIEILPKISIKVASISGLIALKILSANEDDRIQDLVDLKNLFSSANSQDLLESQNLLRLITQRDFNRNKDLALEFARYSSKFG